MKKPTYCKRAGEHGEITHKIEKYWYDLLHLKNLPKKEIKSKTKKFSSLKTKKKNHFHYDFKTNTYKQWHCTFFKFQSTVNLRQTAAWVFSIKNPTIFQLWPPGMYFSQLCNILIHIHIEDLHNHELHFDLLE